MFKKNTKIVKLLGGMGNQMFNYAFGKALEHETGAKVLFDISSFKVAKKRIVGNTGKNKKGVCVRQYEIDIFPNINIELSNKFQSNLVKISNILKLSKKYKEKDPFYYNEEALKNNKYRYFTGYYQNEKYFKSIREQLLHDFELPPLRENDLYNKQLLEEIQSASNPVFIQVRRDDYIVLGHVLSLDYYKKAVEYIKSHIENPTFFVFCAEDPEYIKNEFDIGVEFKLIGEKNKTRETFYENMRLMKACKHGILANSSYCWWAAWLNNYKDKIIIAPTPWLNGGDEIIPEDWIKIDCKQKNAETGAAV